MLFSPFANYEEFKCLFGIAEHGNGVKSRRNKILLSLFKSRTLLHLVATPTSSYIKEDNRWRCVERWRLFGDTNIFRESTSLSSMRRILMRTLRRLSSEESWRKQSLRIEGLYGLYSVHYASDDFNGICEDGDAASIRYVNTESNRVYKMRAGKFLRKLIEENPAFDDVLPEPVKIWLCEEFAEEWKAYAAENLRHDDFELNVDDDFRSIYDSSRCKGDFGSCMVDDGYWTFYRDSVKAKAAYLTNMDGRIVARCIIYTDVIDGEGRHLRLAERQYASECDESLKRMLVMRLIDGGHIDGYKKVGADCHSPRAFVDIHGNPLKNCDLKISCDLENFCVVSYQDSFKSYEDGWAYNSDDIDNLSVTNGEFEESHSGEFYSEYLGEWIDEDEACYVDTREDYFPSERTVYAYVDGSREDCFEDDCIRIGDDWYYAGNDANYPEDYGICCCPECDEYFLAEDGCYSELTEEHYCCSYCHDSAEQKYKEDHWSYSEYDDEYFEDDDEVVRALMWNERLSVYESTTIHTDTLDDLIDDGRATEIDGNVYIDEVGFDGEPVHFAAEVCVA